MSPVQLPLHFNGSAPHLADWQDQIIMGDCQSVLPTIPAQSVDLIVTSPPYADSRKKTYGGIHPDDYVAWFLPISAELLRVLKPSGTFILNIKEKVVAGERHTYVIELILAMRQQGWLWTEEFIWHKKNSYPGKWPNRFRDSWERCLQFNRSRQFAMYQDSVMVPMGDWAKTRLRKLSDTDAGMYRGWAAASARMSPIGSDARKPIRPMCCIWRPNRATAVTAPPSRWNSLNGLSNCSPRKAIWFSIRFPGPAQRRWRPMNWDGAIWGSRFNRSMSHWPSKHSEESVRSRSPAAQ